MGPRKQNKTHHTTSSDSRHWAARTVFARAKEADTASPPTHQPSAWRLRPRHGQRPTRAHRLEARRPWRRGGPGGWKRRRTRASRTTMAIPHRSLKPESQQQSRQNPQPSFTESDISKYRYPHSPNLVLFNDIKAYHFILII